jgi:hypothetical protein
MYNINWTDRKNEIIWEEKPAIITNHINKTVLWPLFDNKCDWNKQKSVINCSTKIWQYVVSLIYCIDKNKNTKFTWLDILLYG